MNRLKFTVKYFSLFPLMFFVSCADYSDELRKIPEYMELTREIESHKSFANFPPMESWRFLIDGTKHGSGPLVFDVEEPGYLAGLSRGMAYALKNANATLTVEFLEKIRKETTLNVEKANSTAFNEQIGGNAVQFRLIISSNATEEGMAELRQKLAGDTLRAIKNNDEGKIVLYRQAIDRAELYPHVAKIVDRYENSSKGRQDIARLCQDLDQLHPFNDGNVRTFVIILMQKELLRNNMNPAILYDPNRFDAYSLDQVELEIVKGQERYKSYLTK